MSSKRVKQYLMLLTAIGLVAIASGGSGTFASFSAEVANPNNTFATGTLYLHDSVSGQTECTSESAPSNSNVPITVGASNPGDPQCSVLFNFDATNHAGQPLLTTVGAGGPYTGAVTTITVAAASFPVAKGAQLTFDNGTDPAESCTLAAPVALNATTVDVTGCTLSASYNSGDNIYAPGPFVAELKLQNYGTIDASDLKFQLNGTGCEYSRDSSQTGYITSLSSALTLTLNGSDTGAADTVNPHDASIPLTTATTNDIPAGATIQIADGTNTDTVTTISDTPAGSTSVAIDGTNLTDTFGLGVSRAYHINSVWVTSLPVVALTAAIPNGTPITVAHSGDVSTTFVTSASASVGDTSLSVTPQGAEFNYPSGAGSTVTAGGLCSDLDFTITETDSTFGGKIGAVTGGSIDGSGNTTGYEGCAFPVAQDNGSGGCNMTGSSTVSDLDTRAAGTWDTLTLKSGKGVNNVRQLTGLDGASTSENTDGGARYFLLTIYPNWQNADMGENATFDLVWHMDQA